MPTFKEQQYMLVEAQHKLAVWEFLFSVLDNDYVSKDGRMVSKAIRVNDCLVDVVPEEIIEDILQIIAKNHIEGLRERVVDIENADLVILDKDEQGTITAKNANPTSPQEDGKEGGP